MRTSQQSCLQWVGGGEGGPLLPDLPAREPAAVGDGPRQLLLPAAHRRLAAGAGGRGLVSAGGLPLAGLALAGCLAGGALLWVGCQWVGGWLGSGSGQSYVTLCICKPASRPAGTASDPPPAGGALVGQLGWLLPPPMRCCPQPQTQPQPPNAAAECTRPPAAASTALCAALLTLLLSCGVVSAAQRPSVQGHLLWRGGCSQGGAAGPRPRSAAGLCQGEGWGGRQGEGVGERSGPLSR